VTDQEIERTFNQ